MQYFGSSKPFCFTEQGVAMLSVVLKSEQALMVNISIMRTFIKMRNMLYANPDSQQVLNALEEPYYQQFKVVFDALVELGVTDSADRPSIGFKVG